MKLGKTRSPASRLLQLNRWFFGFDLDVNEPVSRRETEDSSDRSQRLSAASSLAPGEAEHRRVLRISGAVKWQKAREAGGERLLDFTTQNSCKIKPITSDYQQSSTMPVPVIPR